MKRVIWSVACLIEIASAIWGMEANLTSNLALQAQTRSIDGVDFDLAIEITFVGKAGQYNIDSCRDYQEFVFGELGKFYNSDFFLKYAHNAPLEYSSEFGDFAELKRKADEKGMELLSFYTKWLKLDSDRAEYRLQDYEIYFVPKGLAEQIEKEQSTGGGIRNFFCEISRRIAAFWSFR